ncbi:GNAT family N-acetyltransferase [Saccharibacillus sp. CPCC 101409]|uniref:GNAT family N-acetyltransferase n=1 Tax=Saccharibacillus sp. CPCC 101409 TaxID=3058041 RepID=UPI002672973A|nr:GNAT family N-acetyltransferase [Saccharibacillus sp. CPCC 101409]MDO3409120.1 GNAT family N-acetyltransferase [Saccharibacillus sp. CPCC 101409]
MSEVFRRAEAKDAERLADITYRAYELIRELGLHWPAAHADLPLVLQNIGENECYLLEEDGNPVATVTLSTNGESKAITEFPFVKWFAVDPEVSNKGYGGRLLDWVEREIVLGKHGHREVTLATAQKHPWLVEMYERRGYERILELDAKNGDGIMYLLRKNIADYSYADPYSVQRG